MTQLAGVPFVSGTLFQGFESTASCMVLTVKHMSESHKIVAQSLLKIACVCSGASDPLLRRGFAAHCKNEDRAGKSAQHSRMHRACVYVPRV